MSVLDLQGMESTAPQNDGSGHGSSNSAHSCHPSGLSLLICGSSGLSLLICD